MTTMRKSTPMKRTTMISLLLRQRRGREVIPVRTPTPIHEQAALAASRGNLNAACRRSCICEESCAVAC